MVSASSTDVYIPLDVPIEPTSQMFAFRELESGEMVIVPNIEGERAGDGDGDRNGDGSDDGGDGDVDGMTSGGDVDST